MTIDWASVNWAELGWLSGIAFLAALVANVLSFRRRLAGAILTAILFATIYIFRPNLFGAAEANIMRTACGPDTQKLCAVVVPGQGRVFYCLANRQADLSETCRAFIDKIQARPRELRLD